MTFLVFICLSSKSTDDQEVEVSAHQLCDPPELQGSVVEKKRCGHGKRKLVCRHTAQVDFTQHAQVGNCSEWLNASKFCQNLLVLSQCTIGNFVCKFLPVRK